MSGFWGLHPALVGGIVFGVGPLAIWVIELFRSISDKSRPSWGRAIFKWIMVWLGDTLLAVAVAGLAAYYQHAEVEPSFFTSTGFSFLFVGVAFITLAAYLIFEQKEGAVPEKDRKSIGRFYHSLFFAWMVYILLPGLVRVFVFRQEPLPTAVFLGFVALYGITQVIYRYDLDPFKRRLMKRYPDL